MITRPKRRIVRHKQSAYFTFMIVPDSTRNNVCELRLPRWVLHTLAGTAAALAVLIGLLSWVNSASRLQLAEQSELVETALEESAWLVERTNYERSALAARRRQVEAQSNGFTNVLAEQQWDFDEQIKYYNDKLFELEAKLAEINEQAKENYDKMNLTGSPVTEQSEEIFMGGPYIPITENATSVDSLNILLESVQVSCERTAELMDVYADDVDKFLVFMEHLPNIWPVSGAITSDFGARTDPLNGSPAMHSGTDLSAYTGTNVLATAGGIVKRAEYAAGFGNLVVIDHGYGYETWYGHNSSLLVSSGDTVSRGDTIALSGSTGRSTGPHVHYELRYNGSLQNPKNFVN